MVDCPCLVIICMGSHVRLPCPGAAWSGSTQGQLLHCCNMRATPHPHQRLCLCHRTVVTPCARANNSRCIQCMVATKLVLTNTL